MLAAGGVLHAADAGPAAIASPLDRLKARSAEERWQELRSRLHHSGSSDSSPAPSRPAIDRKEDGPAQPTAIGEEPSTTRESDRFLTGRPLPPGSVQPPRRVLPRTFVETPPRFEPTRDTVAESPATTDQVPPGPAELPRLPGAAGPHRATSNEIKKVTEILPFFDYEPDPATAANDPCRNLCPRPDDPGCKTLPDARLPDCPRDVPIAGEPYFERLMPATCFAWQASDLFHNPLYFEDAQLERYGHTYHHCVQPFVSAGKFGAQLLGLPYQMSIDPMWRRRYVVGWNRPGECVPHLHYQVPFNAKAAAVQAGATTGLFFLIP